MRISSCLLAPQQCQKNSSYTDYAPVLLELWQLRIDEATETGTLSETVSNMIIFSEFVY